MSDWTTHYRPLHRPMLRSRTRHLLLDGLAMIGASTGATERALRRPRVHFVYLHHVFADETEPFRRLVDELLRRMTPLSYGDAVDRVVAGPIDRPYVAFSFDDGFKNNLAAAEILDAAGVQACFFVCPSVIGAGSRTEQAAFARDRLHLPPVEFMGWDDVLTLRRRGHEIGNHTADHLNLGGPGVDADAQIVAAAEALRSRVGEVRHFAWPYGHFQAITAQAAAVARAHHRSVASAVRGAHVRPAGDASRLCVRRDHLIAAWPLRHSLYLLAQSARLASSSDNAWPADLNPVKS